MKNQICVHEDCFYYSICRYKEMLANDCMYYRTDKGQHEFDRYFEVLKGVYDKMQIEEQKQKEDLEFKKLQTYVDLHIIPTLIFVTLNYCISGFLFIHGLVYSNTITLLSGVWGLFVTYIVFQIWKGNL